MLLECVLNSHKELGNFDLLGRCGASLTGVKVPFGSLALIFLSNRSLMLYIIRMARSDKIYLTCINLS